MRAVIASIVLLSAALSCQCVWEGEWEEWTVKYGRHYISQQEEDVARQTWSRNMAYIRQHNSRSDVTYTLEMNQFGDHEMQHTLIFVPEREVSGESHEAVQLPLFQPPRPASWDWRTKGVITPVENQGRMGSADAIAVTECLESFHAIRTGQLVRLSVQEVEDCCSVQDLPGIVVPDPYECISKLGGLCAEGSYPPAPSVKSTCRSKQCTPVANDANTTVHIKKGDEDAMLQSVLLTPLVVYVDASSPSFMFYSAGIFDSPSPSCGTNLNHAMQLVGYGENGAYWILKNSWGANWGMQGYMLMKRNSNVCGVADAAEYPK